jgi:hypothetical protein
MDIQPHGLEAFQYLQIFSRRRVTMEISRRIKQSTRLSIAGIAISLPFLMLESHSAGSLCAGQSVTDRERNVTDTERARDDVAGHDAALKQFNEDFLRLQSADVEILKAFPAGKPADYKRISENAGDIRKRATRIRDYLMLPSVKRDKQKNGQDEAPADQLQSGIPALKDLIQSFVKSPVFQQQSQRADYRDLAQARRDVDAIIDLSAKVKAAAEKMSGAAANPK